MLFLEGKAHLSGLHDMALKLPSGGDIAQAPTSLTDRLKAIKKINLGKGNESDGIRGDGRGGRSAATLDGVWTYVRSEGQWQVRTSMSSIIYGRITISSYLSPILTFDSPWTSFQWCLFF